MDLERLQAELKIEEGSPDVTYLDSKGILSGGVGHNLMDEPEPGYGHAGVPVSKELEAKWFQKDIQDALEALDRRWPWWRKLDDVRQNAMINLCFNMGENSLGTFVNTLKAIETGNYGLAYTGLKYSQYAKDVGPERSNRVAIMIRDGEWQL